MLWIGGVLLPQDGLGEVPTTAPYIFVNQLNTTQTVDVEQGYKSKAHCGRSITYLSLEVFVMVVSVGIDVSKDKHDCFIISSEGEVLADVFTIPNNMDGFNCLLQRIQDCTTPQDKVKVGLEATGHYSYNLLGFLLDNSLSTYVLNPLRTNIYRKSLSLRKTKTDLFVQRLHG